MKSRTKKLKDLGWKINVSIEEGLNLIVIGLKTIINQLYKYLTTIRRNYFDY